ncbi:MAG: hypothetical protein SPI27_02450 [Bacteroidaceae bacterium]|nr:hypothetical protein [Bacteroidaceae bacterium]
MQNFCKDESGGETPCKIFAKMIPVGKRLAKFLQRWFWPGNALQNFCKDDSGWETPCKNFAGMILLRNLSYHSFQVRRMPNARFFPFLFKSLPEDGVVLENFP